MKIHEVKCWSEGFNAIVAKVQRFDYRLNTDRDYQIGDLLVLKEYDPAEDKYTGKTAVAGIEYVLKGEDSPPEWGLPAGYAVLGIEVMWLTADGGYEDCVSCGGPILHSHD